MNPFRKGYILLVVLLGISIVIGFEVPSAQQYFHFTGKVISIQRGNLSVQGEKGETMNFAVGRRTVYIPARLPGVGERVKVHYLLQRGRQVAYQVEILPPPSPPKKK